MFMKKVQNLYEKAAKYVPNALDFVKEHKGKLTTYAIIATQLVSPVLGTQWGSDLDRKIDEQFSDNSTKVNEIIIDRTFRISTNEIEQFKDMFNQPYMDKLYESKRVYSDISRKCFDDKHVDWKTLKLVEIKGQEISLYFLKKDSEGKKNIIKYVSNDLGLFVSGQIATVSTSDERSKIYNDNFRKQEADESKKEDIRFNKYTERARQHHDEMIILNLTTSPIDNFSGAISEIKKDLPK